MGKIYLKNIRIYSYHGCMSEEAKIGSEYIINICVDTDLTQSAVSDNLKDTVDYVAINTIVKEEMKVRSKLLENVVSRIIKRILQEHKDVRKARVEVAKLNPPINGNVGEVSVLMELKQE